MAAHLWQRLAAVMAVAERRQRCQSLVGMMTSSLTEALVLQRTSMASWPRWDTAHCLFPTAKGNPISGCAYASEHLK